MKRSIFGMAVLLLTLTASAQYQECERCETRWVLQQIAGPSNGAFCRGGIQVVWRDSSCVQAPAAMSAYEWCDVSTIGTACNHPNPHADDPGPWPLVHGVDVVCVSRAAYKDQHCEVANQCSYNEPPPGSPLVVNFGNKWDFTGESDPVSFDLLGNGTPQLWTWMARDTDQAFLALDRNGDDQINGAQELFGDYNPDQYAGTTNGFDALREFAGEDRYVMDDDPIWPHLLLWFDRNHDAVSQANEIKHVATYVHPKAGRIWALDTEYRKSDREDGDGNRFLFKSRVHFVKNGTMKVEKYFDVYLVRVQ